MSIYIYTYTHIHILTRGPTRLQATGGGRPAHDWRYGAHQRPHPGVGDAVPLERGVAAGVEEDVEAPQEARQRVYRQREQSHSGNSARQRKGHGVEGTGVKEGNRKRGENIRRKKNAQRKV